MFPLSPILSPPLSPRRMFAPPFPDSPWLVGRHTLSAFVFTHVVISATCAWLSYRARRARPCIWRPQYRGALAAAAAVAVARFARYPNRNRPYGHGGRDARGMGACAV